MSELAGISEVAEKTVGRPVTWEGTLYVRDRFQDQTIRHGAVEQFTSSAGRIYAWAVERPEGPEYVAVMQTASIHSADDAVRAWLVSPSK